MVLLSLCCAAPGIYYWTSDMSNNTYILNQFVSNFTVAQQFCNDNGGHLVSYNSFEEQLVSS
jgi:hypothetical protein